MTVLSDRLRVTSRRYAHLVKSDQFGPFSHVDPLTGHSVRRITVAYPPCAECIGYPCECGTAGEGC